ncbi:MAG TPA: two-component regulator propeller domain-containing protein [Ignavibacteriaceae bacterium]|nr:two-component regulator propeller domain-containing protein [Ignavibacteriaceae bacterium]
MKISYLIITLPVFFLFTSRAQDRLDFNHITIENGLSQSNVTCIFQDQKGFMWFGTQDGLNRFDGYNIKVFKNIPSDTNSLINNFIFSIYETPDGILYIETQGGGFQKFNPLSESFTRLSKKSVDLKNAKISTVGAFHQDSDGVEWTGGLGSGTGLKRVDNNTGKTTFYKHDPSNPASLSDDKVYSVYRDHSGNLWIGTHNGLDQMNEKTGEFVHFRHNPDDPYSISDNWVWPIYEDSRGYLWIGTVNGGLNRFNPGNKTFNHFVNVPSDPTSISDNFIFSIYEDRGGTMWIGTSIGGVNYFNTSTELFHHFAHEPDNKNSLSDNYVLSMCVDNTGTYWIGTMQGGLNSFNYNKNLFKNYVSNPAASEGLSSNAVQTLFEDKTGTLWIGTFSSGLDALNSARTTFKHYKNDPNDPNSLSDNRIYALTQDKQGNIWIGTYGGGLNKLDPATGKVVRYMHKEDDPNSLSSNSVWAVAIDNSGKIWLGTFGGGVNIFDPASNQVTRFHNIANDPTSLSDDHVLRIFIDKQDNVWIGTTKGLSKYIRSSNKFKNYSEQNGLPNDNIYGILTDASENLWISTNKGISKFNPEKETFKNYFYQDGLQGNEFNANAYAKDNITGRLLFGGPNGFNVFNPEKIKSNTYVPPIAFTDYTRYNTDDEEGKPIFEKGISERDSLFLTYKDNIINFQFAGLSYFNNSQNQYKYKLEGFNENWIQLGNSHTITFTNLSPGEYNLRVIGSNNDGVWNYTGASIFIKVTPPWWKTNIAYAFYILIILSVLYLSRRVELKRREQKARMRENELQLKATVAEKRAIEAENERKTKELEEARQLQLSMLPRELPKLPNLEISAFMRTATEVGGDYYDFIVQDSLLNVGFGDATGHGLQAGTMVTLMKGFFTSDAAKLDLKDFMNHCTAMIKEIKLGRILMSFSLLKIKDHKLAVTSAGMPPVYYYNKNLNDVEEILIQGMPLGAMRKFSYQVVEKDLNPGDTILLLTDGLPEQMNTRDEMFDYARVKSHFKEVAECTPDAIIEKLVKSGDEWMGDRVQADDISMIVIKVK